MHFKPNLDSSGTNTTSRQRSATPMAHAEIADEESYGATNFKKFARATPTSARRAEETPTLAEDSEDENFEEEHIPDCAASNSGTATGLRGGSSRRRRGQAIILKARRGPPRNPRTQHLSTPTRSKKSSLAQTSEWEEDSETPNHLEASARSPTSEDPPWGQLPRHLANLCRTTTFFSLSILKTAIRCIYYPLILIVVVSLLALALSAVSDLFKTAFSPFCFIPGISQMTACQWINNMDNHAAALKRGADGDAGKTVQWADYDALVALESKTFDQLLDDSMGQSLSINLKKSEIAVSDLVVVIKNSDFASKQSLVDTLQDFVRDAKVAGRGLSRLSAKFNGALDQIMAVNDHALHMVEKARTNEPTTLLENVNALMPWSPPRKNVDLVVKETFADAMDLLSSQMTRLIVETEVSYSDLNKLEERLSTLHSIVQRENATMTIAKEELLGYLWTKLGRREKEKRNFNQHLQLLKELSQYRKEALAHVVAALHTLQGMSEEMDDIRERVAAPNLLGSKIAPEIHMKSIRYGLERLKESRLRARDLEEATARRVLGLDEVTERSEGKLKIESR